MKKNCSQPAFWILLTHNKTEQQFDPLNIRQILFMSIHVVLMRTAHLCGLSSFDLTVAFIKLLF